MDYNKKLEEVRSLFGEAIWCLYEEMEGRCGGEYAFGYDDVAVLEKQFAAALDELADCGKED